MKPRRSLVSGEKALLERGMTAIPGDEADRETSPKELADVAEGTSEMPQAGEPSRRIDATAAEMVAKHAKALEILAEKLGSK